MKIYAYSLSSNFESDEDIIAFGNLLRKKGRVGIKDAKKYMDIPGSKLYISYRPEYAYMVNDADPYGDGIPVRNQYIYKLEQYLRDSGFDRINDGTEYRFHWEQN